MWIVVDFSLLDGLLNDIVLFVVMIVMVVFFNSICRCWVVLMILGEESFVCRCGVVRLVWWSVVSVVCLVLLFRLVVLCVS